MKQSPFTFKWTCGYRGETWFEVYDHGQRYEVRLRNRAPCPYELKDANGDDVRDEMLSSVGILRRANMGQYRQGATLQEAIDTLTVSPELVAAFNEWRLQEHHAHIAHMESQQNRYGTIGSDDPIRTPPLVACRGRMDIVTHIWSRMP